MNIIGKVRARSSQKNRVKGQLATIVATICTIVLTAGLIVNPIGITAITIVGAVAAIQAGKRAITFNK